MLLSCTMWDLAEVMMGVRRATLPMIEYLGMLRDVLMAGGRPKDRVPKIILTPGGTPAPEK